MALIASDCGRRCAGDSLFLLEGPPVMLSSEFAVEPQVRHGPTAALPYGESLLQL